ncbi:alanine racemase [Paucibacter sp. PLA-PC-4]|uniref:alanine racemase n=1 Tax=Paucibacter sp. PLA-PC-4 TaxID=2993655 RepID=UPI00224A602E|nr:alanine racemase [Paucibacter sp. PLA-PC-4]MCX2863410.1 alanine racemase [Paucibacter sp. PLA-PC-4]
MTTPVVLSAALKGFPLTEPPLQLAELAARQWNVLAGDLPLPLAVIKREALEHNVRWMQDYARGQGVALAPHGKTTMSPQLFQRQLDAGAWGISFATIKQLAVGVASGVRRAVIANQVCSEADLAGLAALLAQHADLRVVFLVDSLAQCALIERWHQRQANRQLVAPVFEVLLEIGLAGGRTGTRGEDEALALAAHLHASPAFRLAGIECYEGLGATGDSAADTAYADALMARVHAVARTCAERGWFDGADEVIVSAGGSGIFDLVAGALRPRLGKPVLGLLRSGCYITHDHGHYKRLVNVLDQRCRHVDGLQSALEVWALVQSCPEPGLAILAVGRRDISFDIDLPTPVWHAPLDSRAPLAAPAAWRITGLNDQHAYLRWDPAAALGPQVGDRLGLGVSHPCTTFDKWTWLPIVEKDYRVSDAVLTHF